LTYGYGTANNGNLQTQTIILPNLTLTQSYTYDALNRLQSATEMNGPAQSWKQTFTYDRFGNRNFDAGNTTIPSPLTNLVIDPANNRFNPNASGQSLINYDNAGNLKHDVSGNSYDYNAENLQITYNGASSKWRRELCL
jgi:hypothetical protein